DGKIYHGAKPGESEIGHIQIDREGTILESRCSGWAVDKRIRAAKTKNPDSALSKLIGEVQSSEAKFLKTALEKNDSDAQKILQETAEDLAFGLSHVVHLFHPKIIILGGGLSLIGERLRNAVENALQKFVMAALLPAPKISLAKLGEDSVPIGALQLAISQQLSVL
ncbi:MAG: ROK family protein, partial [Limisphaerales bacterium]